MLGKRHIPLIEINRPMPAYLPPGQSVTGFCSLYDLARATDIDADGAYAYIAGSKEIRVKVNPRRLFYPLSRDIAA